MADATLHATPGATPDATPTATRNVARNADRNARSATRNGCNADRNADHNVATVQPGSRAGRNVGLVASLVVVAAGCTATARGLYAAAIDSGQPPVVAAMYVLATDGLALVAYSSTTWLRRVWYPWLVVVLAAGLSGVAQGVHLVGRLGDRPPAELRFLLGLWPAVAVGLAAHLAYLMFSRRRAARTTADIEAVTGEAVGPAEVELVEVAPVERDANRVTRNASPGRTARGTAHRPARDVRVARVREMVEGGASQAAAAREVGVAPSQVSRWLREGTS